MSAIVSTVEAAIHMWVVSGSQLAANQVVWAGQRPFQPEGCYIAMRLTNERPWGGDWSEVGEPQESDPDGQIEYTSHGVNLVTLTLECFAAGQRWEDARPERRLARVVRARRLPSIAYALRTANIGFGPIQPVQALNLERSKLFEPRALVEMTLHVNAAITELSPWIETVEIEPTINEIALPVITVVRPSEED